MKKLLALIPLLASGALMAQISIVSSDYAAIGETISRNQDTLPTVTEGSAGANQTWMLDVGTVHVPLTTSVIAPSSTPYAADFSTSNLAMTNDNATYIYFTIDVNNLITTGVAGDLLGTSEILKAPFIPDLTLNEYSTDYGDNFVDTYAFDVTADGSSFSFVLDSIRVVHTGTVYDTCDGWGTTKTLVGEYNSLRVKRVEHSVDEIWILSNIPFPPPTWTLQSTIYDTSTTYTWFAKEGKLPIAELTFDSLDNPDVFTWTNVPAIPVANFSHSNNGSGGYSFTDVSINTPTTWLWDFGDGNTSNTQNPTHQYTSDATYTVCVTVTNASGSDTYCESVVVTGASANPPPVAGFSYTDNGAWQLTFTDLSLNGPMTSYAWTFGDTLTSSVQNPVHQYTSFGTFQVCLTVDNGNGTDMFCNSVTIADTATAPQAPVASFSWSDNGNGVVVFTDQSSNTPTSWFWDFGDTQTSSVKNTNNIYTVLDSTYTVCLTAANGIGSDTYCASVTVVGTVVPQAPVASFTWQDNGNGIVAFTDQSTNTPTSWVWEFGDGKTGNTQNVGNTYAVMDSPYNVCLLATNSIGSDTYCTIVTPLSTTPIGIEDNDFDNLSVYPNPANRFITINAEGLSGDFMLVISNIIGQQIISMTVAGNNLNTYQIDLPPVGEGLYLLELRDHDGLLISQEKFLIER